MVGSFEGGKAGKTLYEYFIDNCRIEFMNEEMMGNRRPYFTNLLKIIDYNR